MSMVDDVLTQAERQRLMALLEDDAVGVIMAALGAEHVRIVGGAVRNALLGEQVEDIDFATTLLPDAVMRRLQRAGFSMHPVGIAHGTVLAARNGRSFEITTLRRDVRTDGRHAVVAFTTDWAEDAQRRDFTMNALYLDAQGRLHDHVGGLADVRARRLRFIGDARQRIREDFLRILRYFRFLARYAADMPADERTLAVISDERAGLAHISRERVRAETQRLLPAQGVVRALELMQRSKVAEQVFPADCAQDMAALARMVAQDAALELDAAWFVRLLALCGVHESLKQPFRLTREECRRLAALRNMLQVPEALPADALGWRRLICQHGGQVVRDAVRLAAAWGWLDEAQLAQVLALVTSWQPPAFPLRGSDVLAAGVAPGAAVGDILRQVKERWVMQDFQPRERAALLKLLDEVIRQRREDRA